ncbi:MAG: FHA domain-containing protein [Planctomycetota bacterium]|jgi:predicted component of type VI protein secretion system
MPLLTFQILEGMERGRILSDLQPPVTIGREEDNGIQLNDERISRFHAKIQEDEEQVILTDLESTNGTRVNGHPVQMHVLRIGDQIAIGRCLLLYGSTDQIEAQIQARRGDFQQSAGGTVTFESAGVRSGQDGADDAAAINGDELPQMFPDGAPPLPQGLRPVQLAQLADALAHLHDRLRSVIERGKAVGEKGHEPRLFEVDWPDWQRLLQVEMDLSMYIRGTSDPDADE